MSAALPTVCVCPSLIKREVAACFLAANRVRRGFGFFGPRFAFSYRSNRACRMID
ncbi:hypothetical protein FRUB_09128 [Fimbriiglobus ruber]|uniref:Uncharacterized protein n=1 Tax=Fimbriiglobus ruber TaxID=1908690 RepID=A0A225DJJ5_9BACT|nr:hypothetical protein FRUB_09128 [Fimbriiglobus ruber]